MSATIEDRATFSTRNGHARCLLCGEQNPASLKLRFVAGSGGTVSAKFKSHAGLQGYNDVLHGGVIAALMDSAMTHCLFHHGVQGLTGDLHVRYLRPVSCGATVEIRAAIVSSRPPLYVLKAELLLQEAVMARAEAKFMQRDAAVPG